MKQGDLFGAMSPAAASGAGPRGPRATRLDERASSEAAAGEPALPDEAWSGGGGALAPEPPPPEADARALEEARERDAQTLPGSGPPRPASSAQPARPQAIAAREQPPSPAEARTPAWRRAPAAAQAPRPLSVSELTSQVKELLEPRFARVLVRGEISNFRGANARGHYYFSLKDERSTVEVKLWATQAQRLKFKLKDGLAVVVEGSLDVYEPQGRYSLIVQRLEPEGLGAMALAFEQLKQKLAQEGLIGERRTRPRRPLPLVPRRVGVVTSVSGAALRDFLKVLHRRHPRLPVLVADARVQGDAAELEVRRALRWLSRSDVDVIVVTRGGGSVDDLWTFNEEGVVRAIWDCPVPVVSAVGHEIDVTLSDLVADVRAPTPSAAAELVAPALVELEAGLAAARARLVRAVERAVLGHRQQLRAQAAGLLDPRRALSHQRLALGEAADRAARVVRQRVRREREALGEVSRRLQRVRPQTQLQQTRAQLRELHARLAAALRARLRDERHGFAKLARGVDRGSPRAALTQASQRLATLGQRLPAAAQQRVLLERQALGGLTGRLDALSPLAVLGRGYAIALKADGRAVRARADVEPGEQLTLRLAGDTVSVRVTDEE